MPICSHCSATVDKLFNVGINFLGVVKIDHPNVCSECVLKITEAVDEDGIKF